MTDRTRTVMLYLHFAKYSELRAWIYSSSWSFKCFWVISCGRERI